MKNLIYKTHKQFTLDLLFFTITIFVFFKHLFKDDTLLFIILFVAIILVLLFNFENIKIFLNPSLFTWGLVILSMISSIYMCSRFGNGVKFTMVFTFLTIIGLVLSFSVINWYSSFLKWLCFGGVFHLIFTWFQVFFTEKSLGICKRFLDTESFTYTYRWIYEEHKYAGISGQIGTNAFFMVLLICYFFSKSVVKKEEKYRNISGLIISCITLIITGKKGLIAAVTIAIAITIFYIFLNKFNKGFFLTIISILSFFLCGLLFLQKGLMESLYNNILFSIQTRLTLYIQIFKGISQNFLTGNGVNSTGWLVGHLGHNIYIQMLYEQGILGLLLLLVALLSTLIICMKKTKRYWHQYNGPQQIFLLFGIIFELFFILYGFTGNPLYDYNIYLVYIITSTECLSILHYKRERQRIIGNEPY